MSSEENTQPIEGEVENKEVQSSEGEITPEQIKALVEENKKLKSYVDKAVEESKYNKGKYVELRDKIQKESEAKLEEQENWKELYEVQKGKLFETENRFKETQKQILKKELNFQVAKHAPDAFDIDDVIMALPKDIINIDSEKLSVDGVSDAVSFLKEKKPYLFNNKKNPGMMSGRPVGDGAPKDFSQMSKEEQDKAWKEAMAEEWFNN